MPKEIALVLRRGRNALLGLVLILGGCATDHEPHDGAPASAQAYEADLESCRSSAAAARTAAGAEGFLVGALLGAAHGAVVGAHHGGADVGAIVGASVGALAGFIHGLSWSHHDSVSACMQAKGYQRIDGARLPQKSKPIHATSARAGDRVVTGMR